MTTSESTTSQTNYNYHLIPTDGFTLRLYPDLWAEIGLESSILLLQLDYWITTKGFERDGQRWLKISAKNIIQWAFRRWNQRKAQREIKVLHDSDLIYVEYFDGPYTTPYIALNKTTIAAKLESIRIVDDVPEPVEGSSQVTKETITDHKVPSTIAERIDTEDAIIDVPPQTMPALPPPSILTTHKDISVNVPECVDSACEEIKEVKREREKRESARSADRAKRATPNSKAKKHENITLSDTVHSSEWDKFCRKLAEICAIDFDLNAGYVRSWASKLWKNGNNGKGYTIDDLDDFIVWWNQYDWRGAKNHTLPVPKQVIELIRQSYEHDTTHTRRNLRATGVSPDHEGYQYITGEFSSYIKY